MVRIMRTILFAKAIAAAIFGLPATRAASQRLRVGLVLQNSKPHLTGQTVVREVIARTQSLMPPQCERTCSACPR